MEQVEFDKIAAYHQKHGDDYGDEKSRKLKYAVIASGLRLHKTGPLRVPPILSAKTLLDVGCGEGKFKDFLPAQINYTGIDLLAGQNILDVTTRYDILVANGIFYKLGLWLGVKEIIAHMWALTKETLAFNSLSSWAPRKHRDELYLDPAQTLDFCKTLTSKVILRHDYMPHDFTIFMYR